MTHVLRALLALLFTFHAAAALAVTGLRYISTAGDYIGGGITQTFLPQNSTITASGNTNSVTVTVSNAANWWQLVFAAPAESALARGAYANAARWPFQSPLGAGLSMGGNGRGCNTLKGWFRVREYVVDAATGVVSRLAIDFVQNCEVTGPPLYGAVRFNSSFPLAVPELAAVAGADSYAFETETVALDGSQSFARTNPPLSFKWSQLDGPPVVLSDPLAPSPTFLAPEVDAVGARLRFRLDVTDAAGKPASDDVIVLIEDAASRRTQISFRGDPGDYITLGNSYRYTPRDALIAFSRNFDGGVSATVNGSTWWSFDSASPEGTVYGVGTYLNAQRFPFQDPQSPGLSLSGDGRGCNTLTGQFTVHEVRFDLLGNPVRFNLSFEQHCEGGPAAAYGEVLLNSVPVADIARRLEAARRQFEPN